MVADRGGVVLWCYGAVVAGAAAGARAQGRAEATADQGQIRSVAKSDDTMDQITLSPGGLERWPKPDRAAYRGAFLERSLASFSLGLTTTLLSGRKH
jgi:hypothetical protein